MNKLVPVCLVVIQVASIIYLAITGDIIPSSAFLLILELLFVIFGLWAMAEMKFRFNIFPSLLKNSKLTASGPYKLVRHPMYTSAILITLIWIINDFTYIRLSAWIILVIVLNLKAIYEEKILDEEFPEYKIYTSKTKKLIPYLY